MVNTGIKAKLIFLIYLHIGEKKLKSKKAKTDEYDSGVGDDHTAEATAATPDFDVAALNKILAQEKKQASSGCDLSNAGVMTGPNNSTTTWLSEEEDDEEEIEVVEESPGESRCESRDTTTALQPEGHDDKATFWFPKHEPSV